jgi:hypothetical protein
MSPFPLHQQQYTKWKEYDKSLLHAIKKWTNEQLEEAMD